MRRAERQMLSIPLSALSRHSFGLIRCHLRKTEERSMRRRDFLGVIGGAAVVLPLAARAQQQAAMPVIGFLHSGSQAPYAQLVSAFRKGLSETGFDEGRNVAIEYRWADGNYDRLPGLVNELLDRHITVLYTGGGSVSAL